MFRHFMQLEGHDCAAACLVMLTGAAYDDVAGTMPDRFESYGLSNAEVAGWLSGWFGEAWKYRRYRPYLRWDSMDVGAWPREPHVATIREGTRGPCHVVVVRNGKVHDPELDKPWPIALYERLDFHLLGVIGVAPVLDRCSKVVSAARRARAGLGPGTARRRPA